MSWNIESIRARFPALVREVGGKPAVFFDGPAGSQVPQGVLDAMNRYLVEANANTGGGFATSLASDREMDLAHRGVAEFLGVDDPDEVAFGANMTTLTLGLARALAKTWGPQDEIVVSRMEHDANYTPWVQAARDSGATLRQIEVDPQTFALDLRSLDAVLNSKTRFVAVGAASNMIGTVNPVAEIVRRAHAVKADVFVDAVHYAPHRAIDVKAWGADYVSCSAYKFFGPHVGILWGRRERLEELPVYKLRPSSDALPGRWMTGTQNHEGIAGTVAAIDHIAALGGTGATGRDAILAGFAAIRAHEAVLCERLLAGLAAIPGIRIWGITEPARRDERVATVSITHENVNPADIAARLAERGIFVWDGNYYALALSEALGLEPLGTVRIGLLHYNTEHEVDRLLEALAGLN